jgi:hypothetical protein
MWEEVLLEERLGLLGLDWTALYIFISLLPVVTV